MKTIQPTDAAQKLLGEVRLARLQLTKAESHLAAAKERARLARQRRKAAKQVARQAKQAARQAKEKVAEAKLALAELEAKLARPALTKVKGKPRRMPTAETAEASQPKQSVSPVAIRKPVAMTSRKTPAKRTKSQTKVSPTGKAMKRSIGVSHELETPIVLIPPEASKATGQIVKEVVEIFTDIIPATIPVVTGVSESLDPLDKNSSTTDQNFINRAINQ